MQEWLGLVDSGEAGKTKVEEGGLGLREQIEKSKGYSVKDGIFYAIMSGFGLWFITPFALRLGGTIADVGFLQTFPQVLGSLIQLYYSRLTKAVKSRKEIVVKIA